MSLWKKCEKSPAKVMCKELKNKRKAIIGPFSFQDSTL
jgi:hypothetical protein